MMLIINKMLTKLKSSFVSALYTLIVCAVAQNCFVGKSRFPKQLQASTGINECAWMAITGSSTLDAIFLGGFTKTVSGLANTYFPTPTYTAVLARINTDTNIYAWRVALASNDEPNLQIVQALSLQSDDEKQLAVAATKWQYDAGGQNPLKGIEYTYFFVVDVLTGSQLSKAVKFTHGNPLDALYDVFVSSHGMVMKNGNIYVTFFPTVNKSWTSVGNGWVCSGHQKSTKIRVGGYNSISNSVIFYSESLEYGQAFAMIDTKMTINPIWLGGTASLLQTSATSNPDWYFALYQLNASTGQVAYQFRFRNKDSSIYSNNDNKQGCIKHMAYDSTTRMFFGSWETSDFVSPSNSRHAGVWTVQVDTSGVPMATRIKLLKFGDGTSGGKSLYEGNRRFVGLRTTMEGNKIHAISFNNGDSHLDYHAIDTSIGTVTTTRFLIWRTTNMIYESIFIEPLGAPTFLLDGSQSSIAYQSFSVGEINDSQNRGMVIPTIQNQAESCYNGAVDTVIRYGSSLTTEIHEVGIETAAASQLLSDTTSALFVLVATDMCKGTLTPNQKTGILLKTWNLKNQNFISEASCNSGFSTITAVTAGIISSSLDHVLGSSSTFSFTPPAITSPICADASLMIWDYQIIWDTAKISKMENLIISVNPFSNTLQVQTVQNSLSNYNGIAVGDTYSFNIGATLPNNYYSEFSFTLNIVATLSVCQSTSITAPTTNNQNYQVSSTAASFTVPDFTVGNSSCTLTYTNTVSAAGTFIQNGNGTGKIFTWFTTDNSKVGSYTLKVVGTVESRAVEMTFNLIVTSSCASAKITINDTLFKTSGNTITQSIWQPVTTVTWTDLIITVEDVLNNVIDCATLVYEFLENDSTPFVSSNEISYDIIAKNLSMQTNLVAKVGSYSKKLKATLSSWPTVNPAIKQFQVEFINSCQAPAITPPTMPNKTYNLTSGVLQFVVDAFAVVPTFCAITYSFTILPPITDPTVVAFDQSKREFTVQSNDLILANPYTITIKASSPTGTALSPSINFQLTLQDPCQTASITSRSQTNPPIYQYSGTASFLFTPFIITPASCMPIYSCSMAASSSALDLCSIPSVSSFSISTGNYSFTSADQTTYPPGTYNFQIGLTVGAQSQIATFSLILQLPCNSATLTALTNQQLPQYLYTGDKLTYNLALFTAVPASCPITYSCMSIAHQSSTQLDCNSSQISWSNSNKVFEFATSDLAIPQGNYIVTYQGQTADVRSINTFVLQLVNPCAAIAFNLTPSFFQDQDYTIGSNQIKLYWDNSLVATWTSQLKCGPFIITQFWTKDGAGNKPLKKDLFQVDFSASTFTIKSDDLSTAGTYKVYFEVALKNYVTAKKSSTSALTIVISKPNTAPSFSGGDVSSEQQTFEILLSNHEPSFVLLGKPNDSENDNFSVSFDDKGQSLISFNMVLNQIEILGTQAAGIYIVEIRLEDKNKDPQTRSYRLTLNVSQYVEDAIDSSQEANEEPSILSAQTIQKDQNNSSIILQNKTSKINRNYIPDPEMKLKSLSSTGVLHFEFNQNFIVPQNVSYINSTVLNITIDILPEDDRQFFNFTWNVTKYEQKHMLIQIYFQDAYYVQINHYINVNVNKTTFFAANETGRSILESNKKMRIQCLPQIQLGGAAEAIVSIADNSNKSVKYFVVGNFALNVLLGSVLGLLWGLLNGLQMLAIMPLINSDMPGNANFFFMQIYTIASFNFIDVNPVTTAISNKLNLKEDNSTISTRMQSFGFQSTSQINSLGIVFILFLVIGLCMLVLALLACISRVRCKKIYGGKRFKFQLWLEKKLQKAKTYLFWNFFIRLFVETYLDNAIANSLRLKALIWHPWTEGLASFFAIIIMAALVIFPIVLWILLLKFKPRLEEKAIELRFGSAYEEIRTSSKKALGYTTIFMIKRLVFTMFIFLLEDRRTLQHFLIIGMLAAGTAYTWESEPFTESLQNFQEVYNDQMVLLSSYSLLVFSEFVADKKAQYQIGWVVCVLICLQIASNIGIIIFVTIKNWIHTCKLRKIKKQRHQEWITKQKELVEKQQSQLQNQGQAMLESFDAANETNLINIKVQKKQKFGQTFAQPSLQFLNAQRQNTISRNRIKNNRNDKNSQLLLNQALPRIEEEKEEESDFQNSNMKSLPNLNDEQRVSLESFQDHKSSPSVLSENQNKGENIEARFVAFQVEPACKVFQKVKIEINDTPLELTQQTLKKNPTPLGSESLLPQPNKDSHQELSTHQDFKLLQMPSPAEEESKNGVDQELITNPLLKDISAASKIELKAVILAQQNIFDQQDKQTRISTFTNKASAFNVNNPQKAAVSIRNTIQISGNFQSQQLQYQRPKDKLIAQKGKIICKQEPEYFQKAMISSSENVLQETENIFNSIKQRRNYGMSSAQQTTDDIKQLQSQLQVVKQMEKNLGCIWSNMSEEQKLKLLALEMKIAKLDQLKNNLNV